MRCGGSSRRRGWRPSGGQPEPEIALSPRFEVEFEDDRDRVDLRARSFPGARSGRLPEDRGIPR
jgi:hypothetical protein